jgi:hypothetical protein
MQVFESIIVEGPTTIRGPLYVGVDSVFSPFVGVGSFAAGASGGESSFGSIAAHSIPGEERTVIQGFAARGSLGQPVALQTGDHVTMFQASGFDGNPAFGGLLGYVLGAQARMAIVAAENLSLANHGLTMRFELTPVGTAGPEISVFEIDGSVTADDLRARIFDVTGGALKRLSRGAPDSGGVGFRQVVIPN